MTSTSGEKSYTNNNDHYSAKPPIFNGENFYCWKDKIESFFLGFDGDLWDMVLDGYTHHVDSNGVGLEKSKMNEHQKRDNKNNHKSRTILVNTISYIEYEKITNRDYAESIFGSLRMTYEGNAQVKETKAL